MEEQINEELNDHRKQEIINDSKGVKIKRIQKKDQEEQKEQKVEREAVIRNKKDEEKKSWEKIGETSRRSPFLLQPMRSRGAPTWGRCLLPFIYYKGSNNMGASVSKNTHYA